MDSSGFQELLEEFLLEARERADEVESLMLGIASRDVEARTKALVQVKRELHTLKGNAGMMGFSDLQQLAHHLEDEIETVDLEAPEVADLLSGIDLLRQGLDAIRAPAERDRPVDSPERKSAAAEPSEAGAGSVRIPFSKIDELVEIQAETLIFRNRLSDSIHRGRRLAAEPADGAEGWRQRLSAAWEEVDEARQALEKTLNQLQEHVTELGMVPLASLYRSLHRVVHDESVREGKSVELVAAGGDTPIDKALLEAASEVLGHLVRNAVIHGIELPDQRARKGKPAAGTVRISASLEAAEVRIDVSDDGAGIDFEALRAQAAARAGAGRVKSCDL